MLIAFFNVLSDVLYVFDVNERLTVSSVSLVTTKRKGTYCSCSTLQVVHALQHKEMLLALVDICYIFRPTGSNLIHSCCMNSWDNVW